MLWLERLAALGILIVVWQLIVASRWLPTMTPPIGEIFGAIGRTFVTPRFWEMLGNTLLSSFIGWLIAIVIGVVLGLVIGSVRFIDRSTSFVIDFGRSFPVIAIIPVMLLLLGQSTQMKIVMVVLAAVWPVLVQTIVGSRRLDAGIMDTSTIYQIPRLLWFRRVLFPSALPFIATGLRISAAVAILVTVGTEILTQVPGLGRLITLAQEAAQWQDVFALLFYAGLVGWGIASLLSWIEIALLKWNRQSDD